MSKLSNEEFQAYLKQIRELAEGPLEEIQKEVEQLSIFDIEIPKPLDEKHQKLKDAMEKLDARFGKGTVIKASLMKKEPDTKEKDEKRR